MSDWRSASRKKRNKIWQPSKEELQTVISASSSLSAVLKYYDVAASSGSYTALKSRIWQEQIDISHIKLGIGSNKGRKGGRSNAIPLDQILVEHSTYSRRALKVRLLKSNLLENKCYGCGIGPEWNDKPLSLQLDHINGISDDNRLENLRILCPNCHAQTETFGSKRRKGTGKPRSLVSDTNPDRRKLPKPHQRKVERPSKDELNRLLWTIPTRQIAKRFGVADNTIVQWAISYGLSKPSRIQAEKIQADTRRPPKEELEKLLWELSGNDICRMFKTTKLTLASWIKHYDILRPPSGYWKKKENRH